MGQETSSVKGRMETASGLSLSYKNASQRTEKKKAEKSKEKKRMPPQSLRGEATAPSQPSPRHYTIEDNPLPKNKKKRFQSAGRVKAEGKEANGIGREKLWTKNRLHASEKNPDPSVRDVMATPDEKK